MSLDSFQEFSRLGHRPRGHEVAVLIVFIGPIIRYVPLQHRPISPGWRIRGV